MLLFPAYVVHLGWQLLRRRARFDYRMAFVLLVPLGLAVFMLVQYLRFGDAFAFVKAQRHWGHFEPPWRVLGNLLSEVDFYFPKNADNMQAFLDVVFPLVFLSVGGYMAVRRYPVALWVFVLCGILLVISTVSNANGTKRYCSSLWPAFLGLAGWCERRPWLYELLLFVSIFLLAVYSLRYMQCGWAG